MIRLGDIAEIVSGYNLVRLSKADQDNKYTGDDFEHDFYCMKLASLTNDIIYRQAVPVPHMSAAILSDENKDKYISQVFSIMKIDTKKIDPRYLCYLLNESNIIARQCNNLLQGSVITRLSANQLKNIEIDSIPMEKQQRLGIMYVAALYQYYLETAKAKAKLQAMRTILHEEEKL